jgi:hypothetical protein
MDVPLFETARQPRANATSLQAKRTILQGRCRLLQGRIEGKYSGQGGVDPDKRAHAKASASSHVDRMLAIFPGVPWASELFLFS